MLMFVFSIPLEEARYGCHTDGMVYVCVSELAVRSIAFVKSKFESWLDSVLHIRLARLPQRALYIVDL